MKQDRPVFITLCDDGAVPWLSGLSSEENAAFDNIFLPLTRTLEIQGPPRVRLYRPGSLGREAQSDGQVRHVRNERLGSIRRLGGSQAEQHEYNRCLHIDALGARTNRALLLLTPGNGERMRRRAMAVAFVLSLTGIKT
jgi:hypothetical protein